VAVSPPVVVGIDLSLRRTAVADNQGVRVIPTAAVADDDHRGAMGRLERIVEAVTEPLVPLASQIELVMIEGYSFGSSTKGMRAIAELGGAVRLALWRAHIPYLDVAPKTLKKYATGSGNAGKIQVVQAANTRLGYAGFDHNEADALWLHAMGTELLFVPVVDLPQTHREALDPLKSVLPVYKPGVLT
jgi:crossover junction endodeoxyribonuclease RuvC